MNLWHSLLQNNSKKYRLTWLFQIFKNIIFSLILLCFEQYSKIYFTRDNILHLCNTLEVTQCSHLNDLIWYANNMGNASFSLPLSEGRNIDLMVRCLIKQGLKVVSSGTASWTWVFLLQSYAAITTPQYLHWKDKIVVNSTMETWPKEKRIHQGL